MRNKKQQQQIQQQPGSIKTTTHNKYKTKQRNLKSNQNKKGKEK